MQSRVQRPGGCPGGQPGPLSSLAVAKALSPTREVLRGSAHILSGSGKGNTEPFYRLSVRMTSSPRGWSICHGWEEWFIFPVGRSGAFRRCEVPWPVNADSTGQLDGALPLPAPRLFMCRPPTGTPSAHLASPAPKACRVTALKLDSDVYLSNSERPSRLSSAIQTLCFPRERLVPSPLWALDVWHTQPGHWPQGQELSLVLQQERVR